MRYFVPEETLSQGLWNWSRVKWDGSNGADSFDHDNKSTDVKGYD